jgi:hypothetical protein
MAIRLKTTRVRPNTGVQWRTEASDNAAHSYYNEAYVDAGKVTEVSNSETELTKISIKDFATTADKDAFIADLADSSSPLYARTQYNISNGITVTHEVI